LTPDQPIDKDLDSRFSRQESIPGWSQPVLSSAKILVAGAGAIGNETLKNLALLGVAAITILDRDVVEESNLCRSVLFRNEDIGQPKAYAAARGLRLLNPTTSVDPLHLDLITDVGAGLLARHDLVLGCLDSIEARWKLNRLCCSANVPWIDAGLDATMGQISFFAGSDGPCYECGMNASMWQRIHERRSCLLAQQEAPERPVATTVTIAALTASLQVQEAVAQLHRQAHSPATPAPWPGLLPGDKVSIAVYPYNLSVFHTKRRNDCLAHRDEAATVSTVPLSPQSVTAEDLLLQCEAEGLELDWDVAVGLTCPSCSSESICIPSWKLRKADLVCSSCERPRTPQWQSCIRRGSEEAHNTLRQLGVPNLAHLSLFTRHGHPLAVRLSER
jgi:hypothetical protein